MSRLTTLKRRGLRSPLVRRARAIRELGRLVRRLRGSVLFDRELYEAQRGRRFPNDAAAALDWVVTGSRLGLVAGPLLVPPVDATSRPAGPVAAAWWSSRARAAGFPRTTAHPLADLAWYVARHPEADAWRGGPLAHYTERGRHEPDALLGPHDPGGIDLVELGRAAVRGDRGHSSGQRAPENHQELSRRPGRGAPAAAAVLLAGDGLRTALDSLPGLLDPGCGVDEIAVVGLDRSVPEGRLVAAALEIAAPRVRVLDGDGSPSAVLAATTADVVLVVTAPVAVDGPSVRALVGAVAADGADVTAPVLLEPDDTVRAAGLVGSPTGPSYAGRPLSDAQRAGNRRVEGVSGEVVALRRSALEAIPLPGRTPASPSAALSAWTRSAAGSGADVRVVASAVASLLPTADASPGDGRRGRGAVASPLAAYADPATAMVLRWAIKSAHPAGPRRSTWGDYHFATALGASLEALGHHVAVDPLDSWYRRSAVEDHVTLTLRGLHRYRPVPQQLNLLWVISHPELVDDDELADFDRVFAASRSWSRRRSEAGRPVTPLLQCTDAARFTPEAGRPGTGERVLFVGNSRGTRRPLVEAAASAGRGLAVYGGGWAGRLPPGVLRADHVDNADLPSLYRSAGVVLNDHWPEMAAAGFLSNRLFDLTAAGARWVSDPADGLIDVFPTGRVAASAAELARLLDGAPATFPSEEELLEASHHVRAEHSFDARARQLSDAVAELVEKRRT